MSSISLFDGLPITEIDGLPTSASRLHLATGLCVAACRQRRRGRFTTATGLINELAERRMPTN